MLHARDGGKGPECGTAVHHRVLGCVLSDIRPKISLGLARCILELFLR